MSAARPQCGRGGSRIACAAGEALTEQGVGQRGDDGGGIGGRDRGIDGVLVEAITAHRGDAGGRSGDGDRAGSAIEPAGITGVDEAIRCDGRIAVGVAPGAKACAGTIGPRSASVPAVLRRVSIAAIVR